MVRLSVVLLERDERRALRALGALGVVHLVRLGAGPDTAPRAPSDGTDAALRWTALLERAERLRVALQLPPRPAAPLDCTAEEVAAGLERAEARVREVAGRREANRARRDELSRSTQRLEPWLGLEIPISRLGAGSLAVVRLGTLPTTGGPAGALRAGDHGLLLALPALPGLRQPVVALASGPGVASLDAALRAVGFEELVAPRAAGTLEDHAAALARERTDAEQERVRIDAELRDLALELTEALAALAARARLECQLEEARRCLPRTGTALLLRGWVPATSAAAVERCLREEVAGVCVVQRASPGPQEEEDVPVLLRASRLLRPFGALVAGFGLPRYREISPTPFLAIGFLIMFGVMFGDVGHGAVLALVGLGGIAARRWRDASVLLLLCGLAAVAGGLVYGSCFGLDRFRALALWRDPLEGDPLTFMAMAMGLGVITISLGVTLNVVNRLRHGDAAAAILDRFGLAGLGFYWSAIACLAFGARGAEIPWPAAAVLALSVAAWLVAGRVEGGRGRHTARAASGGLVAGLVEALETVLVYLANTISFVRLAAYGMSHAALLVAILLAARAAGPPGGVAFGAVLVLGNAAAIVLEGVIAAVQALRLEYYEFFSKFFSGAGRPYAPFRLEPTGGTP